MHESTQAVYKYFSYSHLKPEQQGISKPVGDLAAEMVAKVKEGPELTAGLRKLLEAKDCFVRASLPLLVLFALIFPAAGCASATTKASMLQVDQDLADLDAATAPGAVASPGLVHAAIVSARGLQDEVLRSYGLVPATPRPRPASSPAAPSGGPR